MATIPYARQSISQADIDAVVDVLRSEYLTQGPVVPAFEAAVAEYCHAQHAVAVSSATSALHIACIALGVGRGDVVWTSPITFVASANCALYCGATVDFIDIDPFTYNLSVDQLDKKLELAKKSGSLPKVIIAVHLCGQSCDMAKIYALSCQYNFKIIEDASHAIGSKYQNEPVGNCHYSDITVFSFHPVKIITSGEGGVAVTNDARLAARMQLLRSHGITSAPQNMGELPIDEIWNYKQIDLGFNYRMTDIHAALGLTQLQRIDEFVAKRHAIARRYDRFLANSPLQTPWQHDHTYSSYHLYPIRLQQRAGGVTQQQLYRKLQNAGIKVNLHYIPVYRQPYFEKMGFKKGYCPMAEKYFKETISLPIFTLLTNSDQDRVIDALLKAVA